MKSNNRETLKFGYILTMKNIYIWEKSLLLTILLARERNEPPFINRFESEKNAKYQSGGGRSAKIFNKQTKKKA